MIRRPPRSTRTDTLFPYTTLFRAEAQALRRRQDWQMIQWNRAATAQPDNGAAQFVRLLRDPAVLRERDLVERVLAEAGIPLEPPRSEDRRVGKEWVSSFSSRWAPSHKKKKSQNNHNTQS